MKADFQDKKKGIQQRSEEYKEEIEQLEQFERKCFFSGCISFFVQIFFRALEFFVVIDVAIAIAIAVAVSKANSIYSFWFAISFISFDKKFSNST